MIQFNEVTRRLPHYPVAAGYDLPGDVALLASNETPFAPAPGVVEAAAKAVTGANRYPDPRYGRLRQALSDRFGVAPERIAVGNGSCDVLIALGQVLLEPEAEVVYAWPSFSVYPMLAAMTGAREIRVDLDAEHRHDLDAMATEVNAATRMVLVCNPNNPTSTAHPLDALRAFVERVPPHVAVVLDEAYCEFNLLQDPDDSLDLIAKHPNVVLLRTFSKVYGLAGLRVGYALCGSERFVEAVGQVRQPFHTTAAAQAAAVEALKHQDTVTERVEQTVMARLEVDAGLRGLGCEVAESQANFAWVGLPTGEDDEPREREAAVVDGLRERGVLVRAGTALGRDGWLRVTYGTPAENRKLVDALGTLLPRAPRSRV